MKNEERRGRNAYAVAMGRRRLLKRDLECVETSFILLHVLLLLGGSKYGSRFSLLQGGRCT